MNILILDDGYKSNLVQSKGVALSLFPNVLKIYKVDFKGPSYKLPYRKGKYKIVPKIISLLLLIRMKNLSYYLFKLFSKTPLNIEEKIDFVISTGSYLAPLNVILCQKLKAKSIQIMVPSLIPFYFFDFVIIPYSDCLRLKKLPKNGIITLGVPNCISERVLEEGKEKLMKRINIPENSKIIGILIGGDDQNYKVSPKMISYFLLMLQDLLKIEKVVFLFSTSRRTPIEVVFYLKNEFKKWGNIIYTEFFGFEKENHYYGILGLSELLIVTEDSMNMISECITTGKPVLIIGVERRKKKRLIFDKVIEYIVKENYAEYLSLKDLEKLPLKVLEMKDKKYKKLNDAHECAVEIVKRMKNEFDF